MLDSEIKNTLLTTKLSNYIESFEWDMILNNSQIINFELGTTILRQGIINPGFYIIIEGEVLVKAKILGEGTTSIRKLGRGNILGELNLVSKIPSTTSAIAITPVNCLVIPNDYFEMISIGFPEIKLKLIKAISEEISYRLQVLHQKIISYMTESDMKTRSVFSEVIQTFTYPTEIDFSEVGLDSDHLKKSHFFKYFSDEEYEQLLGSVTILKAPAKCTLISAYEKNNACFIVLRGAVQSSIKEKNIIGKLSVLGPINLFCSLTIAEHTEFSLIDYTTCERAILLKISEESFIKIKTEYPRLGYKLINIIYESYVCLENAVNKFAVRLNSEIYNR